MLKNYTQCGKLELVSLLDAKVTSFIEDKKKKKDDDAKITPWIDYLITFRTKPGDAIFESSVRYEKNKNKFNLIGSIGRLNAYGNQSACVDDSHLRLYCYCLSNLNRVV